MNLSLGNGKIGLFTFLASAHPADTCGTDGLPVTPNSIKIMGRFQALKLLSHPNLCGYVDVLRGKHERLIIVAEHYDNNLQGIFEEDDVPLKVNQIQSIACQTVQAINYLHSHGYVHRNISASNVLFDSDDMLKLSRYGLYDMTNYNADVRFPIGDIRYMAPEVLLLGVNYNALYGPSTTSVDVWSFGMLLLDCFLHGKLWGKLRLSEEKIAMILFDIATMKENVNPLERIINVSNCRGKFEQMDSSLNSLIAACLCADPEKRPLLEELMLHEFIQLKYIDYPKKDLEQFPAIYRSAYLELPDFNKLILEASNTEEEENHLSGRPIEEVYHLWNLAGGDVFSVLRKHNLVNSKSPALTLPLALLNNGEEFGISEKESLTCISTAVAVSLDQLQQRLEHIDPMAYYPLIVEDDLYTVDLSATAELPLVIREKDVEYQFHRIILLERLLDGYPYTRNRIIKEARIDIPPYIRAKVWAALLNITGDISSNYKNIDKDSVTPTDRQIDVDIPRCHQYNNLLSSPTGHEKLKSVLKAWVASHPHLVYWQGLDSLCAPFVALNFNNEALAYSCLKAFIPKYLYNFFQKDNGQVIQEYLAVFKQLIAFHLPDLYNHLEDIGFNPELYAIPWFLTMFSHVFPLHKIYYLWDTLLLGTSLLPLCIGLAILTQFREQLLAFGFNDCILLFSDMPTIDIERCVKESIKIFNKTPPSAGFRKEDNPANRTRAPAEEQFMTLPDKEQLSFAQLRLEVCPRISPRDLVRISQLIQQADAFPLLSRDGNPKNNKEKKKRRNKKDRQVSMEVQTKLIVIDVRSQEEFSSGHFPYSVNVPFSQAVSKEYEWQHLAPVTKIVHANKGKMMMVMGNKGPEPVQLAQILVSLGYRRICVMDGSVSILRNLGYLTATSTS